MKEFKFREQKIIAEKIGDEYKFLAHYKGRNVVYKSDDKTLFDDIDGNERRSKAARSFIYEKIKDIYYNGNVQE